MNGRSLLGNIINRFVVHQLRWDAAQGDRFGSPLPLAKVRRHRSVSCARYFEKSKGSSGTKHCTGRQMLGGDSMRPTA